MTAVDNDLCDTNSASYSIRMSVPPPTCYGFEQVVNPDSRFRWFSSTAFNAVIVQFSALWCIYDCLVSSYGNCSASINACKKLPEEKKNTYSPFPLPTTGQTSPSSPRLPSSSPSTHPPDFHHRNSSRF